MMPLAATLPDSRSRAARAGIRPRLGFLGAGWIGRHRMDAIAGSGIAEIVAIADTARPLAEEAARNHPDAMVLETLDDLMEVGVDGVIIATPSALHAEQAVIALERGIPVFCQKPLGRNADETCRVIDAARAADLLLGVDLSYRFITGIQAIHTLCRNGSLGELYAVDLTFHNAYGPDKAWFYDRTLSGGGCVIDLGIHLVDLALWNLGFPRVQSISSRLFSRGRPILARAGTVEDYAVAWLDVASGATIRLACSWCLPAGRDAVISGYFYGTKGGAGFHNVDGSFYNFTAERFEGTRRETLAAEPEQWGGRAAIDWTRGLADGEGFNRDIETLAIVAKSLDRIYDSAGT